MPKGKYKCDWDNTQLFILKGIKYNRGKSLMSFRT